MLEAAKHAAVAGDLVSAAELLRGAARIQEAELGPLHPDLANTLNNLAIVSEKTGRPADAETFYRRAAAIASASLPADHPMVVDSRQNLEDFCRARGLPIDPIAGTTPSVSMPAAWDLDLGLSAFSSEEPSIEDELPVARAATPTATARVATPTQAQKPTPSRSVPAAARKPSSGPTWVIGAVIVVAAALLIGRQCGRARRRPRHRRRRLPPPLRIQSHSRHCQRSRRHHHLPVHGPHQARSASVPGCARPFRRAMKAGNANRQATRFRPGGSCSIRASSPHVMS